MRLFYPLFLISALVAGPAAQAQQLDPAFVPTVNLYSGNATSTIVAQPDGKILLNLTANRYDGQLGGQLMRLNADGTPDMAFRIRAGAGPGRTPLRVIAVQPDGKILVAGNQLREYDGVPHSQPMRLNADGSLDTSFDATAAGWTTGDVSQLVVQPDGKILVAGVGSGPASQCLTRLLPDGSLDPTFATDTGFRNPGSVVNEMRAMVLQADGKIVLGGLFIHRSASGTTHNALVRFNADGSLDAGFTSPLYTQNYLLAVAQQPDGKLLIGGSALFDTATNPGPYPHVLRLLPDGTVDPTFQQSLDQSGVVSDLRVQANGDIMVAGFFLTLGGQPRGSVARLRSTGALDTGFASATGAGTQNYVAVLLPLPGGSYLTGGYYTTFDNQPSPGLTRLLPGGQRDPSFAPVLTSAAGTSALPLLTGKLHALLGTEFGGRSLPDGQYQRLGSDGSYEAPITFTEPTPLPAGGFGYTPQPDGTFYQTYAPDQATRLVARLLPTGQPDPAFRVDTLGYDRNTLAMFGGSVVRVQPSGKVVLWGNFERLNRLTRPGLAQLLPTGQPDLTFAPPANLPWLGLLGGIGMPRGISEVLPQPGGGVVVLWNDNDRSQLTRLRADGSLDPGFGLGTAAGPTGRFEALPLHNGQLLVRGDFTSFGGQAAPHGLVRLLPDGRPDPTFTAASPTFDLATLPNGIREQPDGRLLILTPGATTKEMVLRRLDLNGQLDASFQAVTIASDVAASVYPHLSLQPADNAVVLSGFFTRVAGQPRFGLARLTNTPLATRPLVAAPVLDVFPNPAHAQVQLHLPARAVGPATLVDLQGRAVKSWLLTSAEATLSLAGLAPGVYVLTVPTAQGPAHQRVVIE